jgi:hypothetical protein
MVRFRLPAPLRGFEQQLNDPRVHSRALHHHAQHRVVEQRTEGIFALLAPHDGLPRRQRAALSSTELGFASNNFNFD